jgi:hypothetical protein
VEAAPRPRTYPSPPMSAPPPSPPISQPDDVDASRAQDPHRPAGPKQSGTYGQGTNHPTASISSASMASHDAAARMNPAAPLGGPYSNSLPPFQYPPHDSRGQHPPSRPYHSEAPLPPLLGPSRLLQGYPSSEEQSARSPVYSLPPPLRQTSLLPPGPADRGVYGPQYGPPVPMKSIHHGHHSYPTAARHPLDHSFRVQRKTKGHVASACIPCKKAHLRCDAQRPCTRCSSNGKEDCCVDMQHKKRGRPRLRENASERQRYSLPPDDLRRPLSGYTTTGSVGSAVEAGTAGSLARYEDPLRSRQYRILKSQVGDPNGPRYIDHTQLSDTNSVSSPVSGGSRPEPVAYLSMRLEVLKASPTFVDIVAPGTNDAAFVGKGLVDLVVPSDRERALAIQRRMDHEQSRKEPNYLPPIFGREQADRVMQSVGFALDEVSQFDLDQEELFSFDVLSDGPPRTLTVRFGLAKRESTFFVVLLLVPQTPQHQYSRSSFASPSPYTPEFPHPYHAQQSHQMRQHPLPPPPPPPSQPSQHQHQHQSFPPRSSGPSALDMQRPLPREGPLPPQSASGYSPGFHQASSAYSPSPSRPDYPGGLSSFQIPRSELPPTSSQPPPPPPQQQQQQPHVQLPPIRSPQPPPSADGVFSPDQRHRRVDIQSLIKKPDPPRRL